MRTLLFVACICVVTGPAPGALAHTEEAPDAGLDVQAEGVAAVAPC